MRIIGGKFGGRRFYPPAKKWPTRPTTDIAKEGLFNILANRIDFDDCRMLDLFGGTGSHCFEFISRGCSDATYVDKFGGAIKFVQEMEAKLGIASELHVVRKDVGRFIKESAGKTTYDYIFAGPPYPLKWLDQIPDLVFGAQLLASDGLFVLEHNPNHDFSNHPNFLEVRNYGETHFAFFAYLPAPSSSFQYNF